MNPGICIDLWLKESQRKKKSKSCWNHADFYGSCSIISFFDVDLDTQGTSTSKFFGVSHIPKRSTDSSYPPPFLLVPRCFSWCISKADIRSTAYQLTNCSSWKLVVLLENCWNCFPPIPRWWFQVFFIFNPEIPGEMIQFGEQIFQLGWYQQLDNHGSRKCMKCNGFSPRVLFHFRDVGKKSNQPTCASTLFREALTEVSYFLFTDSIG